MRAASWTTGIALAAATLLGGCVKPADWTPGSTGHGRFLGIGIYAPNDAWGRLVANQTPKDPSSARPIDDQAIIVVVDSRSGEVRACGDLTGYCVGMNPWKQTLAAAQTTPISVTQHATRDGVYVPADKPADPVEP